MIIDNNALFGLTDQHVNIHSDGHAVHQSVEVPFDALRLAAQNAGFDLRLASSFRPFERQLAIWNAKFCGAKPILDDTGATVDIQHMDEWSICKAILRYSALPGTSRHHWGTDFDFYDGNALPKGYQLQLIAPEYELSGPCAPLTQWLMGEAEQHGFFFPYRNDLGGVAPEPWHISHRAVAGNYQAELNVKGVCDLLTDTDIEGKHAILTHMDEIFERFIHNIAEQ